ncbi:MAG TPA: thioredoxin-dependent thiol peroxidase [Bacteroidia bacterium]
MAKVKKEIVKKTVTPKKKSTAKQVKKAPAKKSPPFKAHTTGLKEGIKAPDFRGLNQEGKEFSLSDYKGKKVILFFYPEDDTQTCTVEACNLRDNLNLLKKDGYEVIGVSPDPVAKHKKYADKYKFTFNLLADTEMKAIKAYDVWGIKQLFGNIYDGLIRTTFIIDEQGTIQHIIRAVKSATHAQQIRNL